MINEETLIAVTVIGGLALLVIAFVKYFMDRSFVQPDLETKTYTRNGGKVCRASSQDLVG